MYFLANFSQCEQMSARVGHHGWANASRVRHGHGGSRTAPDPPSISPKERDWLLAIRRPQNHACWFLWTSRSIQRCQELDPNSLRLQLPWLQEVVRQEHEPHRALLAPQRCAAIQLRPMQAQLYAVRHPVQAQSCCAQDQVDRQPHTGAGWQGHGRSRKVCPKRPSRKSDKRPIGERPELKLSKKRY